MCVSAKMIALARITQAAVAVCSAFHSSIVQVQHAGEASPEARRWPSASLLPVVCASHPVQRVGASVALCQEDISSCFQLSSTCITSRLSQPQRENALRFHFIPKKGIKNSFE